MKSFFFALVTVLVFTSTSALAGDAAAGKAKAALCASCHGPTGISMSPIWPNLAGQKEQYLVKQIKAFRDGTRQDPMMAPMVAALSDADIDNLAAYYSSQK
jgi:cytochrome c553